MELKENNRNKIEAMKNIKSYFDWLVSSGEIEIEKQEKVSRTVPSRWPGVERSITDEYIYYKFKGEDEVKTAIIGDGDFINGGKWGEELEARYKSFIEEMKESGEYYISGTNIPVTYIHKDGIYIDRI